MTSYTYHHQSQSQHQPTQQHASNSKGFHLTKHLRYQLLGVALSLPLFALGCSNPKPHSKNEHTHTETQTEQQEHTHDEHKHEEHDHQSHSHETSDKQDEEHNAHNHEHEHEHEHEHSHATGAKQIIPEGYQVNFAVSNHPLFLLSEAVTEDTPTTVKKLLGAGDVGHHGSLSPSDVKTVKDSEYVVWFGEQLESNLANTLSKAPNRVTLLKDERLNLLNRRDEKAHTIDNSLDPHVWLDPENAKIIVNILTELHAKANPEYAEKYQHNAKQFAKKIDELVAQTQAKRNGVKAYWSSHDAFQYLEKSMNIKLAGALTTDHEIPAKASQLIWLNDNRPYKTMCLLAQSEPKQGIKTKLDPINTQVMLEDMSDSQSYLQAWQSVADKLDTCLD